MAKQIQSLQLIQNSINQHEVLDDLVIRFGGDKHAALQFRNTVISIIANNTKLQSCSAHSILTAAHEAIELNLPISPQLGYVYIVPYKDTAQLQIGYKGIIQLAQRSGQYRTFNACNIYEGMIISQDFITGEFIVGPKTNDNIVGYMAYFELLNGFSKSLYMSVDEMMKHAEKHSNAYAKGASNSLWSTDFNLMARKTILKLLLSKYGPLSTEINSSVALTEELAQKVCNVEA